MNSIPELFIVKQIESKLTYEWLLFKHYSHKVPQAIKYCFGLYSKEVLLGVCVFCIPANREYNKGKCIFNNYSVDVLELSRLVINENLPKNTLSYFVTQSLNKLPIPLCIVSYADSNQNHHGYIYQATNWIYTGLSRTKNKIVDEKGNEIHERTIGHQLGSNKIKDINEKYQNITIQRVGGKFRYLMFLGNKKDKKQMHKCLKWEVLSYPKGDNINYDASYQIKKLNINSKGEKK